MSSDCRDHVCIRFCVITVCLVSNNLFIEVFTPKMQSKEANNRGKAFYSKVEDIHICFQWMSWRGAIASVLECLVRDFFCFGAVLISGKE